MNSWIIATFFVAFLTLVATIIFGTITCLALRVSKKAYKRDKEEAKLNYEQKLVVVPHSNRTYRVYEACRFELKNPNREGLLRIDNAMIVCEGMDYTIEKTRIKGLSYNHSTGEITINGRQNGELYFEITDEEQPIFKGNSVTILFKDGEEIVSEPYQFSFEND